MTPGTTLQPTDIHRIVGMPEAIDILGLHLQVDHKGRIHPVPATHAGTSRLPASCRASTANWLI